jgi:hypothetical protein
VLGGRSTKASSLGTCAIGASIVVLLLPCSPVDVSRFVVSFVVDAVQRVELVRAPSYVQEKRLIRILPARTDTDASSAVVSEHLVIWVTTAREHVRPSAVFGRFFPVDPLPMASTGGASSYTKFPTQAAARGNLARAEQVSSRNYLVSAVTKAHPLKLLEFPFWVLTKHCESTAATTCHVSWEHGSEYCQKRSASKGEKVCQV